MHKENGFNIDEWLWDEFNLSGVFYGQTIDDVIYAKQIGEYEICFAMDNNKNTYMTQANNTPDVSQTVLTS